MAVSVDGKNVYQGTLSDFGRDHASSDLPLTLPGNWGPGSTHAVTVAVDLSRSAGNEFEGCGPTTDFVWIAE